MAQQPITDYPIDPVVTSGTQLADILNRTNQVLNSGNSGTSRPPMVTTGGLWVKTGGATPELYMFDGTADILIAASSQLDGYVAKSGDTMTGDLVVSTTLSASSLVANISRFYSDSFVGNDNLFNLMDFRNVARLANGYQKLPGGLILQWGNGVLVNGVLPVTYPIAFNPAFCLQVAPATGGQSDTISIVTTSNTGFSVYPYNAAGTGQGNAGLGFSWFALGF